MITMIRSAWTYSVDTIGILLGIPKYLDKGMDPELKRATETQSARSYYRYPR
jgi:hypothetical protein